MLRVGLEEPRSLVPGEAMDRSSLTVVDALFESLVAVDTDGELVPGAALLWYGNEDRSSWTFTLRGHDGAGGRPVYHADGLGTREPVVAADVVDAWSRIVRESGEAAYLLEDVVGFDAVEDGERPTLVGLEAVDERTLRVRLRQPDAAFPALAAHPALAPVPTRPYRADPAAFATQPLGNGAFAMEGEWARGQFIRLRRVDPTRTDLVEEVLFDVAEPSAAYVAFQQGRLDVAELPLAAVDGAVGRFGGDAAAGGGVRFVPTNQLYFLGVRGDVEPLDVPSVRRALSLAVDRERLAREVFRGLAQPARGLVPPAVARRPGTCLSCRHDPSRARALFEEAGVDRLEVWFNEGAGHEAVVAQVRRDLAAVGVTVDARSPDATEDEGLGTYLDVLSTGEAPVFRFGWSTDRPDAVDAVAPLVGSRGAGTSASGNHGAYAAEDVDALLDAARREYDDEERLALLAQAERLALNRDQALVPLVTLERPVAVDPDVRGLRFTWLGLPDLSDVRLSSTQ